MERVLVCGAVGFIGSHLVKRLKAEGYRVRGADLKYPQFSKTHADDFIIGDLRDPRICKQVTDQPFDEVYQLAADMSRHMRTTVRLDESLLRQAKREAREKGETLTSLIEQGLRLALARRRPKAAGRARVLLPVSKARGGTFPGIDLNDSAAVLDRMEGRH